MFGTEKLLAKILRKTRFGKALVKHVSQYSTPYGFLKELGEVVVLFLILRATTVESFVIPSASMHETLLERDRIVVQKLTRYWSLPNRGDIVVFRVPKTLECYDPEKPIWIKRVAGLPGDKLLIDGGHIYINGVQLTTPPIFAENVYTNFSGMSYFSEITIPEDHLFLLGDNSSNSFDSRAMGSIPADHVIGSPIFRFWPLNRMGAIVGKPPAYLYEN